MRGARFTPDRVRGAHSRGHPSRHSGPNASSVPAWKQITPGSDVSIVLKEDQPTGREVQGTVQDLLTKGDHPRGVKVRLRDGRVGRVQRMLDSAAESTAQSRTSSSIADIELHTNQAQPPDGSHQSSQRIKYRDVRLDDELEAPPTTNDLSAYIKPAKPKKRKGGKAQADEEDQPAEVVCPMCGEFKGDEAAVAHHVQEHLD